MRFAPSFAAACALTFLSAAWGQVPLTTIAVTGDDAPGGDTFQFFGSAVIDHLGQIAFDGGTHELDENFLFRRGTWITTPGQLRVLAKNGLTVPNPPGFHFQNPGLPQFNRNGNLALITGISAGTPLNPERYAYYTGTPGQALQFALATNDPAPDAEASFHLLDVPFYSDFGHLAFRAYLDDLTNPEDSSGPESVWVRGPISLTRIARSGDQAPQTEPGTVFNTSIKHSSTAFERPSINSSNLLAFTGFLSGDPVEPPNDSGIWYSRLGQEVRLAVRNGDPAPGLDGLTIGAMDSMRLSNTGQLLFRANLVGDIPDTENQALWIGAPGEHQLLARAGSLAPQTENIFRFFGQPAMNQNGTVAFVAGVEPQDPDLGPLYALYTGTRDNLRLVVLEGQPAPGFEGGTFGFIDQPILNNAGQLVFLAFVASGESGTYGLFATDPFGTLHLVARIGQTMDIFDDDQPPRTVSGLNILTGNLAGPGGYNSFGDDGQLAFTVNFTDGAGAVLFATIPEASFIAAFPTLLLFLRARNRHSKLFHLEAP